jgi:hypothetical protein
MEPTPVPEPKIAVVVRDDLAAWQALNVTAFLVSGVGSCHPDLVGEPYLDGSGRTYLPMFRLPVLVFATDAAGMARAFARATARRLDIAVYTDDLFATDNDHDNRAAVAPVATDDLKLAGFALTGPRRDVDKALDKVRLHP